MARTIDLTGPDGHDGPALHFSGIRRHAGTYKAEVGDLVPVEPEGISITIQAPDFPETGDQWGVKNLSSSSNAFTIDGNGKEIENPLTSFSVTGSFNMQGDGISVIWEYCGHWYVV